MNSPGTSLLAGPILRRAEPERVFLWAASREDLELKASIFGAEATLRANPPVLGLGGNTRKVRLGRRLWIHLVEAIPTAKRGGFPRGRLLAYDLTESGSGLSFARQPELCVGGLPLPSFALQGLGESLRALDGSCRKLHGKGEDALAAAGRYLARPSIAARATRRPTALFLGGDQIYADDVARALVPRINELGAEICGDPETLPPFNKTPQQLRTVFGVAPSQLELVTGFTSGEGSNHLFGFSDWAAMYVLAWNPLEWPATWPTGAPPEEIEQLEKARQALPDVRRLLANVPTYMIFDDHEITDDWYITNQWREDVLGGKPSGRRAIANGLAAFWAFQGWGNDPSAFGRQFTEPVASHLFPGAALSASDRRSREQKYEKTLLEFENWAFVAPTTPPALFIDTRTRRAEGEGRDSIDPGRRPPRLVRPSAWDRLKKLARESGARRGEPLVLIAPTPVFNLDSIEAVQQTVTSTSASAFKFLDAESWRANSRNMTDFFEFVLAMAPSMCVVLSGDVHYASAGSALVRGASNSVPVAQFTSSALKNEPPGLIDFLASRAGCSLRLFWWRDTDRVRFAPDESSGGENRSPDFSETVRMEGSVVYGPGWAGPGGGLPHPREVARFVVESNVGLLTVGERQVEHRLLVSGEQEALPARYELDRWPAAAPR